jgi:hypothetical protein
VVVNQVAHECTYASCVIALNVHSSTLRHTFQGDHRHNAGKPDERSTQTMRSFRMRPSALLAMPTSRVAALPSWNPSELARMSKPRRWAAASMPRLTRSMKEKALVLIFEGQLVPAAERHANDLLEAVGGSAGGAVRNETELPHRAHHAFARAGTRASVAVENARDRGDREAGLARDNLTDGCKFRDRVLVGSTRVAAIDEFNSQLACEPFADGRSNSDQSIEPFQAKAFRTR